MGPRRRAFAFHPKGDEPIRRPVLFRLGEDIAPDEAGFLQVHEKPEAGLDRIVFRGKI